MGRVEVGAAGVEDGDGHRFLAHGVVVDDGTERGRVAGQHRFELGRHRIEADARSLDGHRLFERASGLSRQLLQVGWAILAEENVRAGGDGAIGHAGLPADKAERGDLRDLRPVRHGPALT